jgi:hypothetical protein
MIIVIIQWCCDSKQFIYRDQQQCEKLEKGSSEDWQPHSSQAMHKYGQNVLQSL